MSTNNMETRFLPVVQRVLRSWDVLQHAVSSSFGGGDSLEKAFWLEENLVTFFQDNSNLEPFEVSDWLKEIMNNEFDLMVEDHTDDQVSTRLCSAYACLLANDSARLETVLAQLPLAPPAYTSSGATQQQESSSSSDEDEEEEVGGEAMEVQRSGEEAAPTRSGGRREPEVDEDGFTKVGPRGGSAR